ncbi:hypothetical protein [Algoriphagus halophytocola]|uniref:Uncharacterized protein n=1 Tax=Algoriphagus halophytocola TaxID=2991499 RepID=A0ABY6MDH9_9BACT|nr:hypothetical protein [Algoriphagus sp. TR-M5]UZD21815.1 hypothetical protein OM944_14200 [Algoriphagus sp. TR-M5]
MRTQILVEAKNMKWSVDTDHGGDGDVMIWYPRFWILISSNDEYQMLNDKVGRSQVCDADHGAEVDKKGRLL